MRTRPGEAVDPSLAEGYRQCARLTWRHGTTYFWGAALLPAERRRHVHAVYALCRLADDIVDLPETHDRPGPADVGVDGRLEAFAQTFRIALRDRGSQDPIMAAVINTVLTCRIEAECFDRFFHAMAMDLATSRYETWEDLCGYMEGSAAVIGEMMLPVLGPTSPAAKAPARALGLAFQLTNFLRDVDEDLDRGRVYLPQADLRAFGVDLTERHVTQEWRALMAYEIERNRALYRFADTGIAMLPARSARCVGAARVLYSRILDRIEAAGYNVFNGRIRVPTWRKAATSARIMVTPRRALPRDHHERTSHDTSDAS
jgi:15-cis-phytoene synthase